MHRRRYVIVGTGGRATCFARALITDYRERADLVALYDVNSLNAYSPVEGYRLGITGTRARLEACTVNANTMDAGIMQEGETGEDVLTIVRGQTRENIAVEQILVVKDAGAHGGGDKWMFEHLFRDDVPDTLSQAAGARAGAMSCLTGIAANRSVSENRVVSMNEFAKIT